jgi:hypothetical protein
MSWGSLQERKKAFLEDCCGGGGDGRWWSNHDSLVTDGFQSAAPAEGPRAGYDPILGKAMRKRQEAKARRNKG